MTVANYTGKLVDTGDIEARIPKIRERLEQSASGYLRIKRLRPVDRAAINLMIERGEAEVFESPLGRAYRLVTKEGEADV